MQAPKHSSPMFHLSCRYLGLSGTSYEVLEAKAVKSHVPFILYVPGITWDILGSPMKAVKPSSSMPHLSYR